MKHWSILRELWWNRWKQQFNIWIKIMKANIFHIKSCHFICIDMFSITDNMTWMNNNNNNNNNDNEYAYSDIQSEVTKIDNRIDCLRQIIGDIQFPWAVLCWVFNSCMNRMRLSQWHWVLPNNCSYNHQLNLMCLLLSQSL